MKKILVTLVALVAIAHLSYGQWAGTTDIHNTNSGNVGIGTTSPDAFLTVNANTGLSSTVTVTNLYSSKGNSDGSYLQIAGTRHPTAQRMTLDAFNGLNAASNLVLQSVSGGNVGIGTATPATLLDIQQSAANTYGTISLRGNGRGGGLDLYNNSTLLSSIWASGSKDLNFAVNGSGTSSLYINPSGNVGIGTTSPVSPLQVVGHNVANVIASAHFNSSGSGVAFLGGVDGTTVNIVSDYLGSTEPNLHLATWGNRTSSNGMTINTSGNVGIGTTTPRELLSVNGNIRSQQVKVELANWPDYVFKPKYILPSLTKVKIYINKYQHLPDMPSEKDVANEGLNLGEVDKQLTKKVEELTLYLIEQNKQIIKQNKLIAEQQKINHSLQQQINKIAKRPTH